MKVARRVLLDEEQASSMAELVDRLRKDSCKTDTSKVVNKMVSIFLEKYISTEYNNLTKAFFDKKNYLRNLISSVSTDEIDESIEKYLGRSKSTKKRGRKPKRSPVAIGRDETPST